MTLNFTTLFFANYSAKGIALYRSLERTCNDFHVYIFAMDKDCYTILCSMHMPHATIISLVDLEAFYTDLLKIKSSRNKGEYSWTCKGPSLLYCFEKFGITDCTYIDADMYFFNDPTPMYQEQPNADVMLTDHRYTDAYNLAETNGQYCAGYMYFKATPNGLKILHHWTNQCIEWCFGSHELGRFGDQKYLDEFHAQWENVYDIQHIGFCAPWNIQQYEVVKKDNAVQVTLDGKQDNLIFYHFHFLKNQDFGKYNELFLGPYYLSSETLKLIYDPYIEEIKQITRYVDNMLPQCDALASNVTSLSSVRFVMHCAKNYWNRNKQIWRRR